MKSLLIALACLFANSTIATLFAQTNHKAPLSKSDVQSSLEAKLQSTQEIIQWKDIDNHLLWSTLNSTDKMASIGFQPAGQIDVRSNLHQLDTDDAQWDAAKQKIVDYIVQETQRKYGEEYTAETLMPKPKKNRLPYLSIKVMDRDIMEAVMAMPEVRYLEPKTNPDFSKELKSDSGCSSSSSTISSSDYTSITPQSRQSWHHAKHNIPCAWNNSNHGDGIWIAVMDTGISSTQDKLNGDFAEGQSAGRVVEKYNTFQTAGVSTNNWQDQCGHGTSMAGLATAPRGYDNTPAGVSYEANLISYRVTEDVLINTGDEKDGVTEALYHAANDARVNIISMSIGDVFSSGQVEDAVEYAYGKGKLMFAAAGTSTSFTNWYPVIFPAWMTQTVAVTGVTDAANRERCSSCHDGPEVDFVIEMQRASDDGRTAASLAVPNLGNKYVGGSSAATATMAGVAGLVWGNNPSWSRTDVLTRLIQTADNYPTRDNDFGWGAVDVCQAVDNNFSLVCATGVTNEVTMQITNISFPAESDSGSEAEWVISFNGASHFFDVSENGASGDPANYINTGECGSVPIIVDLGMTSCTQSSRPVTISIHEDDGPTSDCSLNGFPDFDDNFGTTTPTVSFNSNTFSTNGFTFTYQLVCSSSFTPPAAGISVPQDTCLNTVVDVEFFATGGDAPYTVTYSSNGGSAQTLTVPANGTTISHNTTSAGSTTYALLNVTDANGCGQTLAQSETITVHSIPTIAAAGINPTTCGGTDGSINISVTNVPNGTYDINYTGGVFSTVSITSGSGIISALSASTYSDLSIMANTCESIEFPDVVLTDPSAPVAVITNDSPVCLGDQITFTATPLGMSNYEFFIDGNGNGMPESGETLQSGSSDNYSNSALADGDIVSVQITDLNCTSEANTTVTVNPIPELFITAENDPSTCGGLDGSIQITVNNVPDGIYDITHAAGVFTSVSITAGTGIISGLSASTYTDLSVTINSCVSIEMPDAVLTDPVAPTADITSDSPVCLGDQITFTATPAGMSNYEFFVDANGNGMPEFGESLQTGSMDSYVSSALVNGIIISVQITDLNCTAEASTAIILHPIPELTISAINDPTTCGGMDGSIELSGANIPDGTYTIQSSTGPLSTVSFMGGIASLTTLSAGSYDDLHININGCVSIENDDAILNDPATSMGISISSDSPQCPGSLTTLEVLPSGMFDYSFFHDANNNGMMESSEQLQTGASNLFGSTTLNSGDVIGVIVTEANSCSSIHMTVISLLPPDYQFAGSGGLTGVEVGVADYETDGILESTQTIDFSSVVDYDSAIEVHLLPGFETVLGAQFEAFIDGCNGGLGGQN